MGPGRQDISLGKAVPGQGSLGVRGQVRIHLRAFCSINFIYALTLISLDTDIYVLLPTPPGTGAGFGESPGHPASSRLPAGEPAACRRPRPWILCLSALGVPYAGGEPAHRGICPIICLLFNEKKGTPIKV